MSITCCRMRLGMSGFWGDRANVVRATEGNEQGFDDLVLKWNEMTGSIDTKGRIGAVWKRPLVFGQTSWVKERVGKRDKGELVLPLNGSK